MRVKGNNENSVAKLLINIADSWTVRSIMQML